MIIFKKFFSMLRLARTGIPEKMRLLKKWEYMDHSSLIRLQQENLKKILLHAYNHVPYYRKILLRSGAINSFGKVNLDKFNNIPLLDKKTIREKYDDLKSDDLVKRKWYQNSSGGSTGEPVSLIQDSKYHDWTMATTFLFDSWTKYSKCERKVVLWGSIRDLFVGKETKKTKFFRWIKNEVWLNAFRMTNEQMRNYVDKINTIKPVLLLSYVESIYELSCYIEKEGLQIHSPRAIMTSAGTLYQPMRDKIEKVFNSRVFNRYGCRELGNIGCECDQHKGLHIVSPLMFVEILPTSDRHYNLNEGGEIVITSLTNFAMPLIRYRIGDTGIWEDNKTCYCGRRWQRLRKIDGRITDTFLTQNGDVVSPEFFIHLIGVELNTGWIRKFQVLQESYKHIIIKIVQNQDIIKPLKYYSQALEKIREKIMYVMGKDCLVEFLFVKEIEPTASGKHRYTMTKICR